ncbi:hypothetical protein SUGI_0332480 [Cryptomeria japonica]|nr:hypothetical protein SUGI_0332480 [Cryptomeria japonica]
MGEGKKVTSSEPSHLTRRRDDDVDVAVRVFCNGRERGMHELSAILVMVHHASIISFCFAEECCCHVSPPFF